MPPTFRRFPPTEAIQQFLSSQSHLDFTYPAVGATATTPPPGYNLDHNRIHLGSGQKIFQTAKSALRIWKHFDLGWVKAIPQEPTITPGVTVAVAGRAFGLWCLMACRIVYVFDTAGDTSKYGFAYGTLPAHTETGEERFLIEWNHHDDSVHYDILAFSKPHGLLPHFANPCLRQLQRRFAQDSKAAMRRAVT
jgi:uncharacterized protein (UPF0548 family)